MSNSIIVINTGSSSIKFSSFNLSLEENFRGSIDHIGSESVQSHFIFGKHRESTLLTQVKTHVEALDFLIHYLADKFKGRSLIIGHRVVHGGDQFKQATLLNAETIQQLKRYIPMAPGHQSHNLHAAETILERYPHYKQVACFDTAFHSTQKKPINQYALPYYLYEQGIKKYGFHGLSYESVLQQLGTIDIELSQKKIIVAHLGNGSSVCAIQNGKSVDSSMGFSTLEGLMMGTRCGSVDAGILLYLLTERKMSLQELSYMLYQQSGLLGVSTISNDIRVLLDTDYSKAEEAIDLYLLRLRKEIAAMVSVLQGVDALIFTGGIGEHQAIIRQRVCEEMSWLGMQVDGEKNARADTFIQNEQSAIKIMVLPCQEELTIARQCLRFIDI